MSDVPVRIAVDRTTPHYWRVRLTNPPINAIDNRMYDEFYDLVESIAADTSLKVVTFESTDPEFFIAHYSTAGPPSRFGAPPWIDAALKLAESDVLSIAVIRGRVRGGGAEFTAACDIRFASREKAIFGQPEIGVGLIPGGGALERLPLLVGRSRALEIVLGADDFNADIAERYGWINRAIPDADLDAYVQAFVKRITSFDRQALAAAKRTINRHTLPARADLQATQDLFFTMFQWPGAIERSKKLLERGIGKRNDFEVNLGAEIAKL